MRLLNECSWGMTVVREIFLKPKKPNPDKLLPNEENYGFFYLATEIQLRRCGVESIYENAEKEHYSARSQDEELLLSFGPSEKAVVS